MSSFTEAFSSLNAAQQEAAASIEGPLMIIAGPGTGKTQTISVRLANILQQTQVRPHNLLALTFTESAAINLKERLARIIGPDAFGITACTFHSFASRIKTLFPESFQLLRDSTQLDEVGALMLMQDILDRGDFPLLRPLRASDYYTRTIISAISTLKREGYSPETFTDLVEKDIAAFKALPESEVINKRTGKIKGKYATTEKQHAKQLELARVFARYETRKEEKGLFDYDDLLVQLRDKLRDPAYEFILASIQEQYLYITVDEFQDTNGVQMDIIDLICSYDAKPNLCIVGDDDQSIYRFQGASITNILSFKEKYPDTKVCALTENYRSGERIIEVAARLIEHNKERITNYLPNTEKIITAARGEAGFSEAVIYGSAEEEVSTTTKRIIELRDKGIPLSEIAILYRNRGIGDAYAESLKKAGISFHRLDGNNALTSKTVRMLIMLLKAIQNPLDTEKIIPLLFSGLCGVLPVDTYKLMRIARADTPIVTMLISDEHIERLSKTTEFRVGVSFTNIESLKRLATLLLSLEVARHTEPLSTLVEKAVIESGMVETLTREKAYSEARALSTFISFVRQFESSNKAGALDDLIATIRLMEAESIGIPLPPEHEESVTLTTIHRAKGLEWQAVFVVNSEDDIFGGKKRADILQLPELIPRTSEHDIVEDERRLFYVALTRARDTLIVSTSSIKNGKENTVSRFMTEAFSALPKPSVPAPELHIESLPAPDARDLDAETQAFIRSLLTQFRLSASSLNTYLACPRNFLIRSLLKLPEEPHDDRIAGMVFGSAMHKGLEDFFRLRIRNGANPSFDIAKKALEKELVDTPLSTRLRAAILRDAIPALEKYLNHLESKTLTPLAVEYDFTAHDVRLQGIPLTGKIDRVDTVPGSSKDVIFVDYKSQRPLSPAQIKGETAYSSGDMYRQMLFYMLLARCDSRFIYTPRTVTVSFVRPDDSGVFRDVSFTPEQHEIDELAKLITEVYTNIQALAFDCPQGAEGCEHCHGL